MQREIGYIERASFGMGGYQGVQFGFFLSFRMGSSGIGYSCCGWADPPSPSAKWTVAEQSAQFDKAARELLAALQAAKVDDISKLVGIPVEVTLEGPTGPLAEWRVLTEAIR